MKTTSPSPGIAFSPARVSGTLWVKGKNTRKGAKPMEIDFESLPQDTQLQIYGVLHKKFGRRRDSGQVTREVKMKLLADVIICLNGLNIAQQRAVLQFTLDTLTNAQHRWWRDEKEKINKKVNKKGVK